MKKNEIIELLKPKCNGYDLPLSLNIELIAEILVNKQDEAINYTRCCTELKALKDGKNGEGMDLVREFNKAFRSL